MKWPNDYKQPQRRPVLTLAFWLGLWLGVMAGLAFLCLIGWLYS